MSAFSPLPLGQRIPDRLHAVSVSIPTMDDLKGYEEKRPETVRQMPSGYPRFVVHPLVRRLADLLQKRAGMEDRKLWLTCSSRMAEALLIYLADDKAQLFSLEGVFGVSHPEDSSFATRAKAFLQHAGGFLSSRAAEDHLLRLGALPSVEAEDLFKGDARAEVWKHLGPLFPGVSASDATFTTTGINAVYSAFRSVAQLQESRGRTIWIQLGWLYLDTIAILQKFTGSAGNYRRISHIADKRVLEKLFSEEGPRIAGIIAEVPTNPLIQTPDLPWLSHLARRYGARLILDPSVTSVYAVDLLPHADLLVTSLTKYSAFEGDVIAGLAVVNPAGPDAAALRRGLAGHTEEIYPRDLARLANRIGNAPAAFALMEENLRSIVRFLEARPEVARVYWARAAHTGEAFAKVARSTSSVGGMLSFELKVPMQPFYDALRLPKGPSFGISSTLVCPFIWLAHYDLVTSAEGRADLASCGINHDLVRLAVGTEPVGEIISALDEALHVAAKS